MQPMKELTILAEDSGRPEPAIAALSRVFTKNQFTIKHIRTITIRINNSPESEVERSQSA